MRALFFSLLLNAACWAQNIAVSGTTVHAVTGQTLAGVHVRIFKTGTTGLSMAYASISDREGRFSIPPIPPGTYFYTADQTGFVTARQSSTAMPFPSFLVTAANPTFYLKVELTPHAVISGRVLDEFGDPIRGITVNLEDASAESTGLVFGGIESTSDDRGMFHFVSGPGKFRLRTQVEGNSRSEIRDGVHVPEYGITYYPSSADKEHASIVEAGPGNVVTGLEIRLSRHTGFTVSGTISGSTVDATTGVVQVVLAVGESPNVITGVPRFFSARNGKYSFANLTPGWYTLSATEYNSGGTLTSASVFRKLEADASIDLVLMAAHAVTGTIAVRDNGSLPGPGLSVSLERQSTLFGPGAVSSPIGADKSFRLEKVNIGKYRVRVSPLPDSAFVESLVLNNQKILSDEIDLSNFTQDASLLVNVSLNGASVEGHALDAAGQRINNALGSAYLLREDQEFLTSGSFARLDPDGAYRFRGLRPGKYRLYAVEAARSSNVNSQTLFEKVKQRAEVIELKEGEHQERDIKVDEKK